MKILKLTVFLILLAGIFSSCTKENGERGIQENFVSKWNLIEFCYYDWDQGEPKLLDYSQYDIIYDFKINNVLTVSGKMDNVDDYRGHTKGNYFYKYLRIPTSDGSSYPLLEIGENTHGLGFGAVYWDFYEGTAMHLSIENGGLVLARVKTK